MDARRAALLLVAAMVVASGCAGSDGPSGAAAQANATTATTTESVGTPTGSAAAGNATPSATTAESANVSLPPGVNASGVADASALVAAHRDALNNTSFSFRFRANVSVGPASQWTVQRGTVGAGLSPLVVHSASVRQLDGDTTDVTTGLWANNSTVVVRYHGGNRTELRLYNRTSRNAGAYDETWAHLPRADLDSQVTQSWLLELALAVGEYDLARTERRDGRRVAVLRATEPAAAANYTDLNATVAVDREGRVRSLSLTATYAGGDQTRVHYDFELTDIGTASVSRPSWVSAATPTNGSAANATTTTVPGTVTTRNATTATPARAVPAPPFAPPRPSTGSGG